jgi:hypothetical protein
MKGFVDRKPMIKMLVDGGAAVNLMPYTTFCKLGKGLEDLFETDMMLKDLGGNASKTRGAVSVELMIRSKTIVTTSSMVKGCIVCPWVVTGSMPIVAFLQQCTNASSNGKETMSRWFKPIHL